MKLYKIGNHFIMFMFSFILSYFSFKFYDDVIITDGILQKIVINYDRFDVFLVYIFVTNNLVVFYFIALRAVSVKFFTEVKFLNLLFVLYNSIVAASFLLLSGLQSLYVVAIFLLLVPFLLKYFMNTPKNEVE